MKTLIILPLILLFAGCASNPYMPRADQGVSCRPLQGENQSEKDLKKKSCIGVDFGYDPVRFHYLPQWERDRLPSMPELN